MLKTSTRQEDAKIVIKLNSAYKNFKIANLLKYNTRAINNKRLRNFQKTTTFITTIIEI